jgi:hypothetical protein
LRVSNAYIDRAAERSQSCRRLRTVSLGALQSGSVDLEMREDCYDDNSETIRDLNFRETELRQA